MLDAPATYVATMEVPAGSAEAIAAALEAAEAPAAMAVTLFERGEGVIEVSAHYAEEPALEQLLALIGAAIGAGDFGDLRIERLLPQDWVARAESLRAPVRAGRFVVHGHHDRGKVPRFRSAIEIDAGLAFGTAHHATTRGCLIALDRLSKRIRPRRILDVGTGTGILAIAAARALNVPVLASDIDPIATATAAANARMNGVGARVHVRHRSRALASPPQPRLCRSPVRQHPAQPLARACARLRRRGSPWRHLRAVGAPQCPGATGRGAVPRPWLQPRFANPSRWMDDLAAPSWQPAQSAPRLIAAARRPTRLHHVPDLR